MVFSIEVLIEPSCQASGVLGAEINTKCAVELSELWGPELVRGASRTLEVRNRYFSQYNS
jgi:hypothetical protein